MAHRAEAVTHVSHQELGRVPLACIGRMGNHFQTVAKGVDRSIVENGK
jgi:hypothetical protein